jgi:hypothetical protein
MHLTSLQVRPEKLLSVSAATDHVMQLLLVKSQLTPSCSVRESSASVMVYIIARHGRAIQFGFGSEARVKAPLRSYGRLTVKRPKGVFVLASFLSTLLPRPQRRKAACPAMAQTYCPRSVSRSCPVVCEPCGRRERYDVERLTRQAGWDAKLTDLLTALVENCPNRGSASIYDRCKAVRGGKGVVQACHTVRRSMAHLANVW